MAPLSSSLPVEGTNPSFLISPKVDLLRALRDPLQMQPMAENVTSFAKEEDASID